jgi:hypothetical protein
VVRSVLWKGVVVERDARVSGSVLTDGVRTQRGERLSDLVVLSRGHLARRRAAGLSRHGDQLRMQVAHT